MGGKSKPKESNSFCIAKSIARDIVTCKGVNIFLVRIKGGLESGLRKDFKSTDEANKRISGCFDVLEGDSNDNDNYIIPRDGKYIVAI